MVNSISAHTKPNGVKFGSYITNDSKNFTRELANLTFRIKPSMVNQAFANNESNKFDEGYIVQGSDAEGSFIKFNNLPLSSPLKYFVYGGDFSSGNGVISGLSKEGKEEPDIIIPDGCREIQKYAFANNKTVVNFIMSDTITEIGVSVFDFYASDLQSKLEHVKLSRNIKLIPQSAFNCCNNLTTIDWYNGLEKIGNWAFINNDFVGNVVLPSTVLEIGEQSFARNSKGNTPKITSFRTNAEKIVLKYSPFSGNNSLKNIYLENDIILLDGDANGGKFDGGISGPLTIHVKNEDVKKH